MSATDSELDFPEHLGESFFQLLRVKYSYHFSVLLKVQEHYDSQRRPEMAPSEVPAGRAGCEAGDVPSNAGDNPKV